MKTREISIILALIVFLLHATSATTYAQKTRAGARHSLSLICTPDRFATSTSAEPELIWTEVISHPGASYIAVHFSTLRLGAADYLKLSGPQPGQPTEILRQGGAEPADRWTRRVAGDTAVLELFAARDTRTRLLAVDCYTAGFQKSAHIESVMGANELENAACYRGTAEYEYARAVARLLVHSTDGDYWGTGFLVSSQNHLLTAKHLISNSAEAASADIDFMAETPGCADFNSEGAWQGVMFKGCRVVKFGRGLDFTLVRVTEGNPAAQFGFLELEEQQAVPGEQIYVPQHAGGRAKQFAIRSDNPADVGGLCRIQSTTASPCNGAGPDVGYYADTEGGSSGSPVVAVATHRVIALHHCGGDINTGITSRRILDQIRTVVQTSPEMIQTPGFYSGLLSETGGATPTHPGLVKLTATRKGSFSANLQLGSRRYPVTGTFDAAGSTTRTITRAGDTALTLQLAAAGTDKLIGSVGDGNWTADLSLLRAVYDGRTNISPENGNYTLVFDSQKDSLTLPAGSGYATARVDRAGRVRLTGSLADGTSISQSASLGPAGEWPLYLPLYSGKGFLHGLILVNSAHELGGTLNWLKPVSTSAKYYPAGFQTETQVKGSGFSGAAFGAKTLPMTQGEVVLSGGALAQDIIGYFTLNAKNRATQTGDTRLSISFSGATGIMNGRMLDPVTSKWIPFKGVVLQALEQGLGYFLGDGQSGQVTVQSQPGF